MLTPAIKRYVKCISVERGAGVYVIACVFERRGDQEVAVSEPKIIRFIPRAAKAIALQSPTPSQRKSHVLALGGDVLAAVTASLQPILSPISELFTVEHDYVLAFHGARPPTVS